MAVAWMLDHLQFGSDRFALKVVMDGGEPGVIHQAAATGRSEAHATGVVTAVVAEALYEGEISAGIHHVEEVIALIDIRSRLEEAGLKLWLDSH